MDLGNEESRSREKSPTRKPVWRPVGSISTKGECSGVEHDHTCPKIESMVSSKGRDVSGMREDRDVQVDDGYHINSLFSEETKKRRGVCWAVEKNGDSKEHEESATEEEFGKVEDCALVIIKEEAQVLASIEGNGEDRRWLTKIDEKIDVDSEESNFAWIFQNIQKFSRMMSVTIEGMEEQVFLFFAKIYRRCMAKRKRIEKEGNGRKKSGVRLSSLLIMKTGGRVREGKGKGKNLVVND